MIFASDYPNVSIWGVSCHLPIGKAEKMHAGGNNIFPCGCYAEEFALMGEGIGAAYHDQVSFSNFELSGVVKVRECSVKDGKNFFETLWSLCPARWVGVINEMRRYDLVYSA